MSHYQVYGLTLSSEIALPELLPARAASIADVVVRIGPVAAPDPGKQVEFEDGEVTLQFEGAGRYRVAGGTTITVDPDSSAGDHAIRIYLLGSAMGAILHQRGLLPLHSNAVVIDGQAVAFAGPPGAGKSTLAAWFYDLGDSLLSDDVCAIASQGGRAMAYPGVPRLRLWRDSLESTGRKAADHAQAFDGFDKYLVGTQKLAPNGPVPLSHVYLLSPSGGVEIDIQQMSGSAAVQALSENTYRGFYLRGLRAMERHFEQCCALASVIPVYQLARPPGFARLAEDVRSVRDHARSVMAARNHGDSLAGQSRH